MDFEEFDFYAPASPAASAPASPGERLQYLVDHTPAIIYATVPSGDFKMTFVSRNAQKVLGYAPEEMLADPNFWFEHLHPDDAPQIFSSLAQLFVTGERSYEYRFRTAQGAYVWMHDTLRLMRDASGTPLEVIGSMTDITERKLMESRLSQAQEQLLQSDKMASIGQLAAGVAHEINNPVGFVNSNMGTLEGYVDTLLAVLGRYEQAAQEQPALAARLAQLRREADLDFLQEDVRELVRESRDGLKRVRDIVQSLKDFSHVDEAEWQVADLHAGLESTLTICANELKYKAEIVRDYGALPAVHCLASQLNQVFMNLLVNAGHAIREKGRITIRTRADDGWVTIAISDTGCGIAPENLGRVFEPFFTTKPVGSGTGLGLSLSYGIVNKHGGQLELASKVGEGSTFTVRLPIKK